MQGVLIRSLVRKLRYHTCLANNRKNIVTNSIIFFKRSTSKKKNLKRTLSKNVANIILK